MRRWLGQHVGEPGQLLGRHLAVVVAGHGGVEGDDPQAGDLVDAVLRGRGVGVGTEEAAGVGLALVVVAHRPHDLGALGPHRGRDRLDQLAQPGVGLRLRLVGEVAGEDQHLRGRVDAAEPLQGGHEPGLRVDDAVLQLPGGEQVRVAEVGDDVGGVGVLTERDRHLVNPSQR